MPKSLHPALSLLALLLMTNQPALADRFSGKVVSVIDGDTISVLHNSSKERVILYGVDCPELGQEYGTEARQFTDQSCYGKTVTLDVRGKDRNGRTIAEVYLADGTDLNHELVRRGLAWWSDKYAAKDAELKKLHDSAKASKTGLWAAANPVAPWLFRNGQRTVEATIKSK